MIHRFFEINPDPGLIISGSYDYGLVTLSIFTAIFAAYFTFLLVDLARQTPIKKYQLVARVTAAIIMSGGIWSMHFVGMLAFSLCTEISYDTTITFLSFIPAFLSCLVALQLMSNGNGIRTISIASILLGSGIGTMHYSGMAAMEMAPLLRYDPVLFGLSIVVAVGLSFIALYIRANLHRRFKRLTQTSSRALSAIAGGFAVSGMHYMGMAATLFIGTEGENGGGVIDSDLSFIALSVSSASILLTLLVAAINGFIRYRMILNEKTANESRLLAILQTAVDGIVTFDGRGKIVSINRSATDILGWKEEQLVGQTIDTLLVSDEAVEIQAWIDSKVGQTCEISARHKIGFVFPARLGLGKTRLPNHEELYVAFISDLTEQKKLQRSLQDKEQQYRSLMNNIPGVAFRCHINESWSMIFASPSIEEVTGYPLEEFLNRRIEMGDLIAFDDRRAVEEKMTKAIAETSGYSIEYRIKRKDGKFVWLLDQGIFIKDKQGEPKWIDGVLIDITERMEYEIELKKAKKDAEQAAQSKQAFLANMSHEIRTPMNAIIGFADILLDSRLEEEQKKYLDTISNSAKSLMHLLNDILDSAKLEKGKMALEARPFSLHGLIDSVVSTFWLQAKQKGIALLIQQDENLDESYIGDEEKIRQVMNNLVGNALKFTEEGKITLRVKPSATGTIVFEIEDTGIGIDSERLDKIFNPFEQADASTTRRFGGTGLGTTISKQIIEHMGGTIGARSQLGQGSCFYFELPLVVSELTPSTETTQPSIETLPPLTLLIVDDMPQNLMLLRVLLEKDGHQVILATNGEEAFQSRQNTEPDVVLMDIHMPVCDGMLATRKIRHWEAQQNKPAVPIVALTASVLDQDRDIARDAGMDGFANKPVNRSQLYMEIGRVLDLSVEQSHSEEELDDAVISIEEGVSIWGSRERYFTEVMQFISEHQHVLASTNTIKQTDQGKVVLHTLKGVAGNLGLIKLMKLLAALELETHVDQCESISRSIAQLVNEISGLATVQESQSGEAVNDWAMSIQQFEETCQKLYRLSEAGELDESINEWLLRHAPQSYKAMTEAMINALNEFDFQQAKTIIQQLLAVIARDSEEVSG